MTAAVDKRIVAAIPMEFTLLNLVTDAHHYYRSLGGIPIAMKEYVEAGIFDYIDSGEMKVANTFLDP